MDHIYAGLLAEPLNSLVGRSILIGVIATLTGDLWQSLLPVVAGLPPANWGLIGRWVAWMRRGKFTHHPITATPAVRGEVAIGWMFHYAVGIFYAALYLLIVRQGLGYEPTLISALAFALILLAAPWFVMQPALGQGFMAARTPKPAVARAISISVHACFGVGLYLGALIVSGGAA